MDGLHSPFLSQRYPHCWFIKLYRAEDGCRLYGAHLTLSNPDAYENEITSAIMVHVQGNAYTNASPLILLIVLVLRVSIVQESHSFGLARSIMPVLRTGLASSTMRVLQLGMIWWVLRWGHLIRLELWLQMVL